MTDGRKSAMLRGTWPNIACGALCSSGISCGYAVPER
jgi:hypothetical protein